VGPHFAPANGPDCIEVIDQRSTAAPGTAAATSLTGGIGECGGVRELILHGPMFQQTDLRVAKRTQIVGRVNFEFAAEALNVFNKANFVPQGQATSTTLNNWRVTTLTGTNTSRVIQLVSRINW
jgi:hypothetical protein